MDGLTEGRIVHFVMPNGEHRPAIIVKNWSETAGTSNLIVFSDGHNDLPYTPEEKDAFQNYGLDTDDIRHGHFWKTSVLYSEKLEPNTWHWIEKA